jgi:hypothetical protein
MLVSGLLRLICARLWPETPTIGAFVIRLKTREMCRAAEERRDCRGGQLLML